MLALTSLCTFPPSATRAWFYHTTLHHTFFLSNVLMHSHPQVFCNACNLSKNSPSVLMSSLQLLLLAAPTSLWGRCGRHNSPPASFVMDLTFCRSDGSHVPVDTLHPSLLLPSSLSSPRCMVPSPVFFRRILGLACWRVQTTSVLFPAPLCDVLYLLSLSLMSSFLTWSLSVWPHAHLHFFISVTSSFFTWELVIGTISIPYSTAGWTIKIILCIFPCTSGGTFLSHRTPDIFLSYSIHTVSSYLLLYSYHHRSTGCFSYIWIQWPVADRQIAS